MSPLIDEMRRWIMRSKAAPLLMMSTVVLAGGCGSQVSEVD
ncbi:MAG: hypothetical protein ACO3MH_02560 [Ilumatobacteraceae bacterium]